MSEPIGEVGIDTIRPDPNQPRKIKNLDQIAGMAKNFLQEGVGIINPIEVDDDDVIVTGEMRWLAAKEAGLATVPVRRYTPATPALRLLRQVSENVNQAGAGGFRMAAMDTARALRDLLTMEREGRLPPLDGDYAHDVRIIGRRGHHYTGPTADQGIHALHRRLGVAEATIRQYISFLAPETLPIIKQALEKEIIGPTVARQVGWTPPEHREAFAKRIVAEAKKGGVDSRAVLDVSMALRRQPENATEIIKTLEAKKGHEKTVAALRRVAPTLSEAVDAVAAPGHQLDEALDRATLAIRNVGNVTALPPVSQRSAYLAIQRLRDACDDFLAGSDADLAPIEGELIAAREGGEG